MHYTLAGDANLDGTVNALDFNAIATSFGATSGKLWINGDSTYDGAVNTADFVAMSQNFGATLPGANLSALAAPPLLGTLVPEPASGLLALGFAATLLPRRRSSRSRLSAPQR